MPKTTSYPLKPLICTFVMMKTTTKLFLFVILLGIMFLTTTCNKRAFAKVTWQGTVWDSLGGKPVQGIWVTLIACNAGDGEDQCDYYTVGQSITDASGHFYIHDDAARSNRYSPCIGEAISNGNFILNEAQLNSSFSNIYLNQIP
jgi:hypothetical protein